MAAMGFGCDLRRRFCVERDLGGLDAIAGRRRVIGTEEGDSRCWESVNRNPWEALAVSSLALVIPIASALIGWRAKYHVKDHISMEKTNETGRLRRGSVLIYTQFPGQFF